MIQALQLILALSILVLFHEFGHYITARIFGMKVSRFYLFFNPWFSLLKYYPDQGKLEIIGWTTKVKAKNADGKEEVVDETPHALLTLKCGKAFAPFDKDGRPTWAATMYGIGWLPLGGYCAIDGMVDETTSADQLSAEPEPWEFRAKPAWQRLIVMAAGVVFNFILAVIIYAGIVWCWGERMVPYDKAYEGMDYVSVLHQAGFQDGDILLTVNDEKPGLKSDNMGWDIVQPGTRVTLLRNHADTVAITIPAYVLDSVASLKEPLMGYRVPVIVDVVQPGMPAKEAGMLEGDRIVKVANDTTPALTEFFPALAQHPGEQVTLGVLRDGKYIEVPVTLTDNAKLGIQMRSITDIYPVEELQYSILESIPRGCQLGTGTLVTYVKSLKLVFTKEGASQVGGFGTLGTLYKPTWNWYNFWWITAFLSVILAFMNIIPIPGLDGGHILFTLYEVVTGRKVPDKFLEWANTIGFALLFLLLIYANGNDLIRFLK